jgi:muramoyltetrapeptide carboxypeptidase
MSQASRDRSSSVTEIRGKKPKALKGGAMLAVIAPASPANEEKYWAGVKELKRLGYGVLLPDDPLHEAEPEGYFAASTEVRREEFLDMINSSRVDGIVAVRGGYGSNYILDGLSNAQLQTPKCFIGFSDITTLQIYLWQSCGWITIHGPMVAAELDAGADVPGGYDEKSLRNAISKTDGGWQIPLQGEKITSGAASGTLLGGCMTLVEATMGTPWELDTRGAILLLEDRAMKPYQVDRVLMHFKQAKKFDGVAGIVLGEFPECEPPVAESPTVRDVCERILAPLGVPVVFGAPVGHTPRPMLTFPLGIKARLNADGEGLLEILEPAVTE